MSKTIVITGGGGFVGRHLTTELLNKKLGPIVVWDKDIGNLPRAVTGVVVDITDPASYRDSLLKTNPAWVVHLAALSAPSQSFDNLQSFKTVNVDATLNLLTTIVAKSSSTKVLVISSADIYGTSLAAQTGEPIPELLLKEAKPANPYAESKFQMEQLIEKSFNNRVIRVRPFPHIGPGQSKGFVTADFASQIAAIEVGRQEPVIKVGNLSAKRDFTDVRDVVCAYRLLLDKGKIGEIYHIASGKAISIKVILNKLLALTDMKIAVTEDPTRLRPSDSPILVGNAEKLQNTTGWQPNYNLDQSLRDILDFWREQELKD